jgi:N-formylglutamate deformylase
VACLPHGGVAYPAELTGGLAMSPDVLWSDWRTQELYDFLPELGITTVTTAFSRFVADVNRDPDGEQHGSFWTSVVPAYLPTGEPVYREPLTAAEIRHRIQLVHEPFHRALDAVVERLLGAFPRLLLLDLHSFGVPLDGDIILGDRRGGTARPEAVRSLSDAFTRNGFTVRINERFTGGWTIRRFAANDQVDAIQVELNQRHYLVIDWRGYSAPLPSGAFDPTKHLLRLALGDVAR